MNIVLLLPPSWLMMTVHSERSISDLAAWHTD
jgi:hypothetical protein